MGEGSGGRSEAVVAISENVRMHARQILANYSLSYFHVASTFSSSGAFNFHSIFLSFFIYFVNDIIPSLFDEFKIL